MATKTPNQSTSKAQPPGLNPTQAIATFAQRYLRMTSYCTTTLAHRTLSALDPPLSTTHSSPNSPLPHVLDLACGPAVLTSLIKASHPTMRVTCADLSPEMVGEVDARIAANAWTNVKSLQADGRDMAAAGVGPDSFSHVVMGLGLPIPGVTEDGGAGATFREIHRVLRPGGVLALTTWADRVWPEALWAAAKEVRPLEGERQSRAEFVITPEFQTGGWLFKELEKVFGMEVEVRCIRTATEAGSLDELVDNMMLGAGVFFPGFSEEELVRAREAFKKEIRKLRTFEEAEDGSVKVGMRAWLGMGWKGGDTGEVC